MVHDQALAGISRAGQKLVQEEAMAQAEISRKVAIYQQSSQFELANASSEVARLSQTVQRESQEAARLRTELALVVQNAIIIGQQQGVQGAAARREIIRLRSEVLDARRTVANLEALTNETNGRNAILESEIRAVTDRTQSSVDARITVLYDEISVLRQMVQSECSEHESLKRQNELLTGSLKFEAEVLASLRAECSLAEALQLELNAAEIERDDLRAELAEWEAQGEVQEGGDDWYTANTKDDEATPSFAGDEVTKTAHGSGAQTSAQKLLAAPPGGVRTSGKVAENHDIATPPGTPRNQGGGPPKEAEKINLSAWPQPTKYRAWRMMLVEEVVAASTTPDAAFKWIKHTNKEGIIHDDLQKSYVPFSGPTNFFGTLDAQLAAALTRVATGDFPRRIQLEKFKAFESNGHRLAGPHINLPPKSAPETNSEAIRGGLAEGG